MNRNSKYIRFIIKIGLLILVLSILKATFFSWGQIEIIVYNNTSSDQSVWLSPKNKYTYTSREGKKKNIKYSTEDFTPSIILNYYNNDGTADEVILSEYVEKHQRGKVIVEMNQSEENGKIDIEITNKIK